MQSQSSSSIPSLFLKRQQDFKQALSDEITSLRKLGGQTTTITDGRLIGKRRGNFLYSFTTDSEIRFPDETPVDVISQKRRYPGTLLSIDGFDLLIAIEQNIGDSVSTAKMTTEPWFLLQELQKRLDFALESSNANHSLALNLLGKSTNVSVCNSGRFSDFCARIEHETKESINCNFYQSKAVDHVLQKSISFIWGPPGTGKTSTLGLAVASLVHAGESVLVLAHSNTAVDTAMKSLAKYLCFSSYYKEGLIVRFGIATPGTYDDYPLVNPRKIIRAHHSSVIGRMEKLEKERRQLTKKSREKNLSLFAKNQIQERIEQIREEMHPIRIELRALESKLVREAKVVGCTLSKAAIAQEIHDRQFDAVIIDEASMAYIPHCFYAATLAKRRIAIFGDFRQLGPISQSDTDSAKTWLQRDVFEEAGVIDNVNRSQNDERLVLLQTQYRMHPSISAIPNQMFYTNQLQDGEKIQEWTQPIVDAQPNPGESLIFYDLSLASSFCLSDRDSHSRFNIISALIAADIAYKSQHLNVGSIGIITPYQCQSRLIHRILKEVGLGSIKASTVHRFQGSEQNLIIFDAVDSEPQKKVGLLLQGGMKSTASRLANVAISRAKGKFIGLFNDSYVRGKIDSFNVFRKFIDRLRVSSRLLPLSFLESNGVSKWSFDIPGVSVYESLSEARKEIHLDLASAKEKVAIDWPVKLSAEKHFSLNYVRVGTAITARGPVISASMSRLSNTRVWRDESFSNIGFVGVDEKILWIYPSPISNAPVFKISLPSVVELLYKFLQLIPLDDGSSIARKIENNQFPFGCCEICNNPLWPQPSSHRYASPRVECLKHPHQGHYISQKEAAQYAQFMKRTCEACNSALKALKSGSTGKIFFACSREKCGWRTSLEQMI